MLATGRIGAADRPVGLGQIDSVPRHRRHLALWRGPHRAFPTAPSVLLLPQKPYMPIGTLRPAVAYPASPTAFSRRRDRARRSTPRGCGPRRPSRGGGQLVRSASPAASSSASPSRARCSPSPTGCSSTRRPRRSTRRSRATIYTHAARAAAEDDDRLDRPSLEPARLPPSPYRDGAGSRRQCSRRAKRRPHDQIGASGTRRRPLAEDAREDGEEALAVLDALAGAPAQRSLCRAGQARRLSLARRL